MKVDRVHRNARIHTLDPARPWASVLLVADGRVAAELTLDAAHARSAQARLWPEQGITVGKALHAYTLGGARAMGTDDVTGSLQAGKSADFVVLDRDPFAVPVDQLGATVTEQTWFAGRKVYDRSSG